MRLMMVRCILPLSRTSLQWQVGFRAATIGTVEIVTTEGAIDMRLRQWAWRKIDQGGNAAPESRTNEEVDREFRDFVESISVSQDQLAATISKSEFTSILG